MIQWLTGALSGLVAGAVYGLTGYWKNKRNDDDSFDFGQFLLVVIPSGIIGGVLGAFNLATDSNIALYFNGTAGLTITAILKKVFNL